MYINNMKKYISILFVLLFSLLLCSNIDTDGDGYSDSDELKFGSDPNDKKDGIYQGGWPYNSLKDEMKSTELPISCPGDIGCECMVNDDCSNKNCTNVVRSERYCFPKIGDPFPRLITLDQFGEEVDLYDFANQDKLILIEMGAAWCKPCQQLAAWFSYDDDSITKLRFWKEEYNLIKEKVQSGEIIFITILYENALHENASFDTIRDWYEKYPDDMIPLFADDYKDLHYWMKPNGLPCINLLNENMELLTYTGRGFTQAFDFAVSALKVNKSKE